MEPLVPSLTIPRGTPTTVPTLDPTSLTGKKTNFLQVTTYVKRQVNSVFELSYYKIEDIGYRPVLQNRYNCCVLGQVASDLVDWLLKDGEAHA